MREQGGRGMCYKAEQFITDNGRRPVTEFILGQRNKEIIDWIISGIEELEKRKGMIQNQNLETKHIKGKIFELKYKKLAIRILYAYHPRKRKFLLLLHGVVKKRNDLKASDIKVAEERYEIEKNRKY
jgi:hypothetical protein